jgi:hypothetical protein
LDEAFGVGGVGRIENLCAVSADRVGAAVVDISGCVERDAGVAVLVLVPTEEVTARTVGVFEAAEPGREVGPVRQGADLALAVGFVVRAAGPAVATRPARLQSVCS